MTSRVSIILPPSMFSNEIPSSEHFIATILKPRKIESENKIYRIIPSQKKIEEIELTEAIHKECCNSGFVCIDDTPYNIFYKEGEEEWDMRIPEYHKSPLTFKGECYITGNMYKNNEEGWKVLHIPYSIIDVTEWIYWR